MKSFMDDDFLLETETARRLYHDVAKQMPIFDFHSHLIQEQIAKNTKFSNLYELWLTGDHYKWRAMRSFGIDENLITGNASPYEKYEAFASMIPYTIGNPLYHWTHLELQRYFGITTALSRSSARAIWDRAEEILATKAMGAADLLLKSNVRALCTTDDPADDLAWHKTIAQDPGIKVRVLPTFRPDKALAFGADKGVANPAKIGPEVRQAYLDYLPKLEQAAGIKIESFKDLLRALEIRHDYFHSLGGRLSDHALQASIYQEAREEELEDAFARFIDASSSISSSEAEALHTAGLAHVAKLNHEKGWVMQLHIGALRNNNSRQQRLLGPDTGYDSIVDGPIAVKLAAFMDSLDKDDQLPKTIIYNLNPADNYLIGTLIGNFQGGSVAGKIQFGSGWWFNDQKDGMLAQLKALGNLGLLSRFVGMLTDSRSFMSFPRHEYFRRILCNLLGGWVENGEYPADEPALEEMVKDICYRNAVNYFGIEGIPLE